MAVLGLAVSGCDAPEPLYGVRGRVEFADGQPVTFGVVECYAAERQRTCRARIQSDGTFQIGSERGKDGAVAGRHQVIVTQLVDENLLRGPHGLHLRMVHPRYQRYDTSGLTMDVSASAPNTNVVFRVEAATPRRPRPAADDAARPRPPNSSITGE